MLRPGRTSTSYSPLAGTSICDVRPRAGGVKGYPETDPCATRTYGDGVPGDPSFPGPPGPEAIREGQPLNPVPSPHHSHQVREGADARIVVQWSEHGWPAVSALPVQTCQTCSLHCATVTGNRSQKGGRN